jgi:AcrR family transcriptional regulator
VSRITVYNQFGSKAGLLHKLAYEAHERPGRQAADHGDPREQLRNRVSDSCARWSSNPALFRRLPQVANVDLEAAGDDRALAERLAGADQLRAGCSIKEAEDVIGAVTSFAVFDRLHKDGRRSQSAVVEILMRLASTVLS